MTLDAIFFDLGFTLVTIPGKNVLKQYIAQLKKGLLQLSQYLRFNGVISDQKLFFETFKTTQNTLFRESYFGEQEFTTADVLRLSLEKLGTNANEDLATTGLKLYHEQENEIWRKREGARELLEFLKDELHVKVGVISNAASQISVEMILQNEDLSEFIDVVISSALVGLRKPSEGIFLEAISALNCAIKDVMVMVGDDIYADIYGGNKMGMKTIHINRGFYLPVPKNLEIQPDATINSLDEVIPIIKNWY